MGRYTTPMRSVTMPSRTTEIPESTALFLPEGYRQRASNETLDVEGDASYWSETRARASAVYQHHVYAWAAQLVKERGGGSVLDVGCGTGAKLATFIAPWTGDIEGIDQPTAAAWFDRLGPKGAVLRHADLERPGEAWRTFDIIICADVLEHLADPRPAMRLIRESCHATTMVILSTPDRERLRGRSCMSSDKPEHVREWGANEFRAFVRSQGFRPLRRRFVPQDDAGLGEGWAAELAWRRGQGEKSPRACCAILCERR